MVDRARPDCWRCWPLAAAAIEPPPARQAELLHLLRHDCGSCHGLTLKGGLGPPLLPATLAAQEPAGARRDHTGGRAGHAHAALGVRDRTDRGAVAGAPAEGGRSTVRGRLAALGSVLSLPRRRRRRARGARAISASSSSARPARCWSSRPRHRPRSAGSRAWATSATPRSCSAATAGSPTCSAATADSPRSIFLSDRSPSGSCRPATRSAGRSATTVGWSPSPTTSRAACGCSTRRPWHRSPTFQPTGADDGRLSKVVGLVDAAGATASSGRLYDAGEIWVADLDDPAHAARSERFPGVGKQPYDGNVTPGRPLLPRRPVRRGRRRAPRSVGSRKRPAPHPRRLRPRRGAAAGLQDAALRGLGRAPATSCSCPRSAATSCWWSTRGPGRRSAASRSHGQPVFAVARPGGRQVWVNFAHPDNGSRPGDRRAERARSSRRCSPARRSCTSSSRRAASRSGSPRGTTTRCWSTTARRSRPLRRDRRRDKPSGIFFTARANRIGQ